MLVEQRKGARVVAVLALSALVWACDSDPDGDENGTPCTVDTDCAATEVCVPHEEGEEHCVTADASTRPALDEVSVPAGEFRMGCDATDPDCAAEEQPVHAVDVPAFRIDRREVSVAEFMHFMNAPGEDCAGQACVGAFAPIPTHPLQFEQQDGVWISVSGREDYPMAHVTWFGADAYCKWRGQRLCSEAQWEKAARGGCELAGGDCQTSTPLYPWGSQAPDCTLAHWWEGSGRGSEGCGDNGTAEVDAHPSGASPYGALNMAGNVWEWVADWKHSSYAGAPTDGSAWVEPASQWRVIKGGGAASSAKDLRAARRGDGAPDNVGHYRGFRCCRAAPE